MLLVKPPEFMLVNLFSRTNHLSIFQREISASNLKNLDQTNQFWWFHREAMHTTQEIRELYNKIIYQKIMVQLQRRNKLVIKVAGSRYNSVKCTEGCSEWILARMINHLEVLHWSCIFDIAGALSRDTFVYNWHSFLVCKNLYLNSRVQKLSNGI